MCLRLRYLTWSPDAFGYDLTTVGNQEAERLFALPSVLFRHFGRVTDPKPKLIFNLIWSYLSARRSRLQRMSGKFVGKKTFRQGQADWTGAGNDLVAHL